LPLETLTTTNPPSALLNCKIKQMVIRHERKALLEKLLRAEQLPTDQSAAALSEQECELDRSLSALVKIGLVGLFEIIKETADDHEDLCCHTLKLMQNIIEGQEPGQLRRECDSDLLEKLFETLLGLSTRTEVTSAMLKHQLQDNNNTPQDSSLPKCGPIPSKNNKNISSLVNNNVSSVASACLISLVITWQNAARILTVITSFIADCSMQKCPLYLKIPQALVNLQRSVMGILTSSQDGFLPNIFQAGLMKGDEEVSHLHPNQHDLSG